MAFENIQPLESPDVYLDIAIKKAIKKTKQKKLPRISKKIDKIRAIELNKMTIIKDILDSKLSKILEQFPYQKDLNPYYKELLDISLDKRKLGLSLSKVRFVHDKTIDLFKEYNKKIKESSTLTELTRYKKQFFARLFSIFDSIRQPIEFLKKARGVLRSFPTIKQDIPKIAIAGFPNVGKSTLLSKISSSRPDIDSYAFTTKTIMIGYIFEGKHKIIQLLDTPGTLNRKDKMNNIERQSYLAMKLVTDQIIYIFDLTLIYPLEDQLKLYERIKKLGKPMIIYLSKTDVIDKEKIKIFKKRFKDVVTDLEEIKERLLRCVTKTSLKK